MLPLVVTFLIAALALAAAFVRVRIRPARIPHDAYFDDSPDRRAPGGAASIGYRADSAPRDSGALSSAATRSEELRHDSSIAAADAGNSGIENGFGDRGRLHDLIRRRRFNRASASSRFWTAISPVGATISFVGADEVILQSRHR